MAFLVLPEDVDACIVTKAPEAGVFDRVLQMRLRDPSVKANRFCPSGVRV